MKFSWRCMALLLLTMAVVQSSGMAIVEDEIQDDSQFDSLEKMLGWAIRNSDPEKLGNLAQDTKNMSPGELAQRRLEIQKFLANTKLPTDTELMKVSIDDLQNESTSTEGRLRALNELIELVEPIHNANNLDKLGGLKAIIDQLGNSNEEIRTAAAWALGKACQNNPTVQNQAFVHNNESDFLDKLMRMSSGVGEKEAPKAIYAISALLRNNPNLQRVFFKQGGESLLRSLLYITEGKVQNKCANLVEDLASEPDSKIPPELVTIVNRVRGLPEQNKDAI